MSLNCVTITGADDSTDPVDLVDLTQEFPFVEWGILIGSHDGPRFPSVAWIHELVLRRESMNNRMQLSLHVCGKMLREIAAGQSSLLERLGPQLFAFDRVQLNWHGEKQRSDVGENVLNALCRLNGWDPTVIFQLDGVNDLVWKPAGRRFACCGLFDRSHGAGRLPDEWPVSSMEMGCGWAGGLGPDNLAEEIPKITAKAFPVMDFWIDMETNVRTDDDQSLDMDKVRKCLEIAEPFVGA